jgi:hypothetical protein
MRRAAAASQNKPKGGERERRMQGEVKVEGEMTKYGVTIMVWKLGPYIAIIMV